MQHTNTWRGYTQPNEIIINIGENRTFDFFPLEGEGGRRPDEGESKTKTFFMNLERHPLTCPTGHPLPQGRGGTAHGFTHKGHPEFISGSTPFVTIPNKEEMLKQVQHDNRHGFTLIELLVVVLIIGILAAVAVPQYTKAVEKSRVAEARILLKTIAQQFQLCVLSKGADECLRTDSGHYVFDTMDVSLPGTVEYANNCLDAFACIKTKDWEYSNSDEGYFYAFRVVNGDTKNSPYYLYWNYQRNGKGNEYEFRCENDQPSGAMDCKIICGADRCSID